MIRTLSLLALVLPLLGVHAAPQKPNIVLVLVDDIGVGDIACFNPGSGAKSPAIDALAKEGMMFRQVHSTAAICAPSRYALLCGNYVYRGAHPGGTWTHCKPSQILPGQQTLADVLRKNGYRTAFLGKLHMGGQFHRRDGQQEPADFLRNADLARPMFDGPIDHGFDYSLALLSGIQQSPFAFFENDRLARWNPERNGFDTFATDAEARQHLKWKGPREAEEQVKNTWHEKYHMDNYVSEQVGPILAFKALEFIDHHVKETPDRPFLLYLALPAAHYPFTPPVDLSPADPDDYGKPGSLPIAGQTPTKRSDMVFETDQVTGVVVEKLKKLGLYENTIVVYTSDNGAAQFTSEWERNDYYCFKWGHFGGSRTDSEEGRTGKVVNPQGLAEDGRPLKGQKGDIYEGGHRIPLVFSGGSKALPKAFKRGGESRQLVALNDFFATFCELAGVPVPAGQALDSVSFAKVLDGSHPEDKPLRGNLVIHGRVPVEYEQSKVLAIAAEGGWSPKKEHGSIVALEGRKAPDPKAISGQLERDRLGYAIYRQENGKRWKLILSANKDDPAKDIEPWALHELAADPVEAINLLAHPEHRALVESMIGEYKSLL